MVNGKNSEISTEHMDTSMKYKHIQHGYLNVLTFKVLPGFTDKIGIDPE